MPAKRKALPEVKSRFDILSFAKRAKDGNALTA
jgi:hypothetical protein